MVGSPSSQPLTSRMADAVSRTAEPDTEPRCRGFQKSMVVGVFEIVLNEIVIHILDRDLGPGTVQVHGLQFQHDQRAGGILSQGLVHFQTDLMPCLHFTGDEMRLNELLG